MATNDIYDSKGRYERTKSNIDALVDPKGKEYFCKNPENLEYFRKLFLRFEAQDTSYVRRLRIIQVLKVIVHNTAKNLKDVTRDDTDQIVAFVNQHMSAKTASDFKKEIKYLWKILLPELDEKGRPDESIIPYPVRHLKIGMDKSKQIGRQDRLTWPEIEKLIGYFNQKPCIQAYLMIALESLARPQELLYRKLRDVQLFDNYAKIQLRDHGKEGIGLLQCIDAYSYLISWLNAHPFKTDQNSYLFLNEKGKQLTPPAVNKNLTIACRNLNIDKPVTCYSLKRNGVTIRRLRGDSDMEIQHVARWTSTRQIKTYDMSQQEDALKIELIKRGLIEPDPAHEYLKPKTKLCLFCREPNKFTDLSCTRCGRPLDRKKIVELEREKELKAVHDFMNIPQIKELFKTVTYLKKKLEGAGRIK